MAPYFECQVCGFRHNYDNINPDETRRIIAEHVEESPHGVAAEVILFENQHDPNRPTGVIYSTEISKTNTEPSYVRQSRYPY